MTGKVRKEDEASSTPSVSARVFVFLWFLSLLSHPYARAQVKPGDTLAQENWQAAKGLMPEPILRRFADGSYRAKVITLPGTLQWGSKFAAATEACFVFCLCESPRRRRWT